MKRRQVINIKSLNEILMTGADSAIQGHNICQVMNISLRDLTRLISRERQAGVPICASTDAEKPGYYLASSKADMARYCRSLSGRINEMTKTLESCQAMIDNLPEEQGEQ